MTDRARRHAKARVKPARRDNPPEQAVAMGNAGRLLVEPVHEPPHHLESSPALSAGDVDADWQNAASSGEEAVGGSAPTPDQDIVDEIGRALGVEQPLDAEVITSDEILHDRDRHYWYLEREAADEDDGELVDEDASGD
jgi:Family of unknown function (DUF6335)